MVTPAVGRRGDWLPACWAGIAVGVGAGVGVLTAGSDGAGSDGAAAVGLPTVDTAVRLGAAATRAAVDVAGVACVGLALLGVLLERRGARLGGDGPRRVSAVHRRADRALLVAAGAWLVAVTTNATFRAAEASGGALGSLRTADLVAWTTQLGVGRGMLLTALCAAATAVMAVTTLHRDAPGRQVVLMVALLGVLTPAVTGHAASADFHTVAVVTTALHVTAAALWVGGLAALLVLLTPHRGPLGAVLPAFSVLATVCIAVVAVTGVVNAAVRMDAVTDLLTTGYGAVVSAKAAGTVAIAGLGLVARRRLASGRSPALRWTGVEVAVMATVLGLAAALTQSAP